MRKYQQLCLVVISLLSITFLIVYRNENGRLKYVLEVVNFFGQKELPIKEENTFEYTSPLPIWQRIGNGFHAYSAFWHKDALAQGGEITTLVVGLQHSIVRLKCDVELHASSNTGDEKNLIVPGKFGFIREEIKPSAKKPLSTDEKSIDDYIIYKFICKINRKLGTPKNIIFTDTNTSAKHSIPVRDLGLNVAKQQLVSCLNLLPPKTPFIKNYFSSDLNLLEHFYHHHVLGVEEFIVYDNEHLVSPNVRKQLAKSGIRANLLPFNFPFELTNTAKIRKIIELDCELRTLNISHHFIMTEPNEYMYADSYLKSGNSTFLLLDVYAYPESNRFEILTNTVCLNATVGPKTRLISDNILLADSKTIANNEIKRFTLYRPKINRMDSFPIKLPKFRLFVNRYIHCLEQQGAQGMDEDKLNTRHTWPASIDHIVQKSFMWFLNKVNIEVTKLKLNSDTN